MTADRVLQERVRKAPESDPLDPNATGVTVTSGVVDDLRVETPATAQPDDTVIAQAAANALTWYRAVPRDSVQVAVRDGWVTLTGTVSQISERGAAERAISRLRGVRGISNAITVSGEPETARS